MADTIVTNSPERDGSGGAGWVVALVIIIAVVVGGVILYRNGAFRAAAPAGNTDINVTLPTPKVTVPTPDVTIPTPDVTIPTPTN